MYHTHSRIVVKLLNGLTIAGAILLAAAGAADAARAGTCTVNGTEIASGKFPPADTATPADVTVTGGKCTVSFDAAGKGIFKYRNVNIYNGGELAFVDNGNPINFYALSILVEKDGALTAGTAAKRFGSLGGKLTIHLWGSASDGAITCKTGDKCGVPDKDPKNPKDPDTIWSSNPVSGINPTSCVKKSLPGGVMDCFYAYERLDDTDPSAAYFGRKVLAVSYGGTLKLFGEKGSISDITINPADSGKSWLRLKGSLNKGDQTLTVDGDVGGGPNTPSGWQDKDHIVVTTTDFLPEHSEELIIDGTPTFNQQSKTTTVKFKNADGKTTGVLWPHNGVAYPLSLPDRLHINRTSVETRAAVALLTRSITIVSDGDTAGADFTEKPGNYFGGDTIVRQGFAAFQVQGVEFYQLGKGGLIMHYPVHFHMARLTPQSKTPKTDGPLTYLKDCSIHDSMTRWVTVHGTQGVTLARNVGYMSIGHGFYLEDGTETDNKLYSNIGVLARAAVDYPGNARQVPGILTARPTTPPDPDPNTSLGFDGFPFFSDSNHPSVFWIMNGWNDFEYNMAAGAGTCGACYWYVPGAVSGPSQYEHWFGYAGEQQSPAGSTARAGITPLQEFVGNSCTSAMNAFTVNSKTATCNGVDVRNAASTESELTMLASDGAKKNYKFPLPATDTYWPHVSGGNRYATRCPDADQGRDDAECTSFPRCDETSRENCDVTVLDRFTTSFNWAEKNLAAVWMRPQWSLVINSAITDVLNAGLNFVTSGGYSKSDVLTGFWALARQTVFVGTTQSGNPLADESGPFNPLKGSSGLTGLKCAPFPNSAANNSLYCLAKAEGISIQLSNFSVAQRMFSIYDGPAYQDSNAYLNIHPTYLTSDGKGPGPSNTLCKPSDTDGNPCANSGYMNGYTNGVRAYRLKKSATETVLGCYLPNAAIGWKQPNGFYYAPAFHSNNLFFDGVDIRHFVTEPLFKLGTFEVNLPQQKTEYCFWAQPPPDGTSPGGSFNGFTDIDRETVLNDDDGSLTGLTSQVNNPPTRKTETISVNQEDFFNAPAETLECASDVAANPTGDAKLAPATAKTSPYEYVTTALFAECGLDVPDSDAPLRLCNPPNKWGSACTSTDPSQVNTCAGILLYRQFLTEKELAEKPDPLEQAKRMMGQNSFQRSGLTVNHGSYYIDTSVTAASAQKQFKGPFTNGFSPNEFVKGQKYELYFLYAKPTIKQTYKLFIGKGLSDYDVTKKVLYGHTDISHGLKFAFTPATRQGNGQPVNVWPTGWVRNYDSSTGYLTLGVDMSARELQDDFDLTKPDSKPLGSELCQPSTMCSWNKGTNQCQCNISDKNNYLYDVCHEKTAKCAPNCSIDCTKTPNDPQCVDAICSWSVKDLDCPLAGCEAVEFTMPDNFQADDAADHHRPAPVSFASDQTYNWKVPFNAEDQALSGKQCHYDQAQLP